MSNALARRTVDFAYMPPLSDEQRVEIAALAAQPDAAIDTSDIPVMPESFWKDAVRGRFYRPLRSL